MSPELLLGDPVDSAKCDAYAFGILLWCVVSGQLHPYASLENTNAFAVQLQIVKGVRPRIDPRWPKSAIRMMEACWGPEPATRPSFEQLNEQGTEALAKAKN
jgi:hypothetical protein